MDPSLTERCLRLMEEFLSKPQTIAFRSPVLWKESGLLDYPSIIKKAMDLGTVKENLQNYRYHSLAEFATDMRLIWSNCVIYNKEGSELYTTALDLQGQFEEKLMELSGDTSRYRQSVCDSIPSEPSEADRSSFCQNIQSLTSDELGKVVTVVYEHRKDCLHKVSATELEIQLDHMDPITFHCIDAYVRSCIGNPGSVAAAHPSLPHSTPAMMMPSLASVFSSPASPGVPPVADSPQEIYVKTEPPP